jgi:hypothetical protein
MRGRDVLQGERRQQREARDDADRNDDERADLAGDRASLTQGEQEGGPRDAAIRARADVRNSGEKPPTATRVAGNEPLKMMTPRIPLPQPTAVRLMTASL